MGNKNQCNGTLLCPWKTISKAHNIVRREKNNLNNDIRIIFLDGTYELTQTVLFDNDDSGTDRHTITYKALHPGNVIISGGSQIKNWSDNDGDGIWEAKVPKGIYSRQLYVNGIRAIRARSIDGTGWSRSDAVQGIYQAPVEASQWKNANKIELVTLYRWKMNRSPIESIHDSMAYISPAHWNIAKIGPYGMQDSTAKSISWVENAFELLDQKGEWYLSTKKHKLYYMPREGERLTGKGKVKIILPRLEKLISGNSVKNITFDGLHFSYATWRQPSRDKGYVSIQSGALLTDANYSTIEDAFEGLAETMGNIEFTRSKNIIFKSNTFSHLGATALRFGEESQKNIIFNNIFTDISSSAIVIGDLQKHHVDGIHSVKDNIIDNNLIHNVAVEFYDAVGLKINYTTRTIISNNTLYDLSSSAISTGWGWGRYDVENFAFPDDNTGKGYNTSTIAKKNIIYRNKIYNFTQKIGDSGGIYNLGASLNSRILQNLIYSSSLPESGSEISNAIYLDNGTRGVEISENGSFDIETNGYFCNGCEAYNTLGKNTLLGDHQGSFSDMPNNLLTDTGQQPSITSPRSRRDILSQLPTKLQPVPLAKPPRVGSIMGKKVVASNHLNAIGAIDNNIKIFWNMGVGNTKGWWQVELDGIKSITNIQFALGHWSKRLNTEIYLRKGVTFQLQASKDGVHFVNLIFYANGSTQSTINETDTWTTKQAINDILLDKPTKTKFIRLNIIDTNNQNLGLLRFKINGNISANKKETEHMIKK